MSSKDAVKRWQRSAQEDMTVSRDMMKLRHFDWALFMGQLSLEKLLKGLITQKTDDAPPFIHDLVKLARLADITLTNAQQKELVEITRFHVKARYEKIKSELYKKATKSYAGKWFRIIEEYSIWLNKRY